MMAVKPNLKVALAVFCCLSLISFILPISSFSLTYVASRLPPFRRPSRVRKDCQDCSVGVDDKAAATLVASNLSHLVPSVFKTIPARKSLLYILVAFLR